MGAYSAGRPRKPDPGGTGGRATYHGRMSDVLTCVNHRNAETRLSCSSCGDPICVRCARSAAVGQKCPSCAKLPRSARATGRPRDYVRLAALGLPAAAVGGVVYGLLVAQVGFGIILGGLLGFGIGRLVGRVLPGRTLPPFPGLVAGLGVLAVAVGYVVVLGVLVPGIFGLLAYAAAGYFAMRGLAA